MRRSIAVCLSLLALASGLSACGRGSATVGDGGPGVFSVPAAGGAAVSVTDSRSLHQSPVWSRDGRTLYYVSNRDGPRDVYALDVAPRAPGGAALPQAWP